MPLPPGFVLDQPGQPKLPPGFVLDQQPTVPSITPPHLVNPNANLVSTTQGGTVGGGLHGNPMEPAFPIPRIPQQQNPVLQVGAGLVNSALSIPEFMESPVGVATLPLGGLGAVVRKLMTAGFGGYMASQVPALAREAGKQSSEGTLQQAVEADANLGAGVVLPGVSVPFEGAKLTGMKGYKRPSPGSPEYIDWVNEQIKARQDIAQQQAPAQSTTVVPPKPAASPVASANIIGTTQVNVASKEPTVVAQNLGGAIETKPVEQQVKSSQAALQTGMNLQATILENLARKVADPKQGRLNPLELSVVNKMAPDIRQGFIARVAELRKQGEQQNATASQPTQPVVQLPGLPKPVVEQPKASIEVQKAVPVQGKEVQPPQGPLQAAPQEKVSGAVGGPLRAGGGGDVARVGKQGTGREELAYHATTKSIADKIRKEGFKSSTLREVLYSIAKQLGATINPETLEHFSNYAGDELDKPRGVFFTKSKDYLADYLRTSEEPQDLSTSESVLNALWSIERTQPQFAVKARQLAVQIAKEPKEVFTIKAPVGSHPTGDITLSAEEATRLWKDYNKKPLMGQEVNTQVVGKQRTSEGNIRKWTHDKLSKAFGVNLKVGTRLFNYLTKQQLQEKQRIVRLSFIAQYKNLLADLNKGDKAAHERALFLIQAKNEIEQRINSRMKTAIDLSKSEGGYTVDKPASSVQKPDNTRRGEAGFVIAPKELWDRVFSNKGSKADPGQMWNRLRNVFGEGSATWKAMQDMGLKAFLTSPRSTQEVEDWANKNQPKVEVRKFGTQKTYKETEAYNKMHHEWFDLLSREDRGKIEAALQNDTERPELSTLENTEKAETYIQLRNDMLDAERLVDKEHAHWQSIAPKSEKDMPGYVEIAVVKPVDYAKRTPKELATSNHPDIQFPSSHNFPPNTLGFVRGYMETVSPEQYRATAIKAPDGSIYEGTWHSEARDKAIKAGKLNKQGSNGVDGFITESGKFVTRDQANNDAGYYVDRNNYGGLYHNEKAPTTKGKKIFHVIEVQSDWAQRVREEKESALGNFNKTETDPLLPHYERLALKAAIDHARSEGATKIAVQDFASTAIQESHDVDATQHGVFNSKEEAEPVAKRLSGNVKDKFYPFQIGDKWVVTDKLAGDQLHYDRTLPKIAEELTGSKGERVSFGEHKKAFENEARRADGITPVGREDMVRADDTYHYNVKPRKDLIFRNPDGTPKTDVSARVYDLKAKPLPSEFSLYGKSGSIFPESPLQKAVKEAGGKEAGLVQTATEAFKNWFGKSKVVDIEGKPLVVYHATLSGGFDVFHPNQHFGTLEQASRVLEVSRYPGVKPQGGDDSIYPVYLSIQNPKRVVDRASWDYAIRKAKKEGYDGLVYNNEMEGEGDSYLAFYPNQIKSAVGNKGTFDRNNPSITGSVFPESKLQSAVKAAGGKEVPTDIVAGALQKLDSLKAFGSNIFDAVTDSHAWKAWMLKRQGYDLASIEALNPNFAHTVAKYNNSQVASVLRAHANITKVLGDKQDNPQFRRQLGGLIYEDMRRASGEIGNPVFKLKNSPFANEAQYQAALKNPEMQKALAAWKQYIQPLATEMHEKLGGGMAASGKETGAFANLIAVLSEDRTELEQPQNAPSTIGPLATMKRGSAFSKERKFTGEEYNLDAGDMAFRMLTKNAQQAALRDVYAEGEKAGLLKLLKPGDETPAGMVRQPNPVSLRSVITSDAEGKQESANVSRWLAFDKRISPTLKQALQLNTSWKEALKEGAPALHVASQAVIKTQVGLGIDLGFHTFNDMVAVANSPKGLAALPAKAMRLAKATHDLASNSPELQEELAKMAEAGVSFRGESLGGWSSKFLKDVDTVTRLVLNREYDNLIKEGTVKDVPAERRRYINGRAGQYNKRFMTWFQQGMQETGLGSFNVAGRNFNRLAVGNLTLSPGVKAASNVDALRLRLSIAAGIATAALIIPATVNIMTTGQAQPEGTSLGDIVLHKNKDGRYEVINMRKWTMLDRGARASGVGAVMRDQVMPRLRGEQPAGLGFTAYDAAKDIGRTAVAPFSGPPLNLLSVGLTGRTEGGLGYEQRTPGEKPPYVQAMLGQLNPLVGPLVQSSQGPTVGGRIAQRLGSVVGMQESSSPFSIIRNRAAQWKNSNNIHTDEASFAPSEYLPLKQALLTGNIDSAKEQYQQLVSEKANQHPSLSDDEAKHEAQMDLQKEFSKLENFRFVNKENEDKFKASLSPEQRKMYDTAIQQQKDIANKFFSDIQPKIDNKAPSGFKPPTFRRTRGFSNQF